MPSDQFSTRVDYIYSLWQWGVLEGLCSFKIFFLWSSALQQDACFLRRNPKASMAGRHDLLSRKKKQPSTWHDGPFFVPSLYFHFGSPSHKCLVILSNNNIIWKLCADEWDRSWLLFLIYDLRIPQMMHFLPACCSKAYMPCTVVNNWRQPGVTYDPITHRSYDPACNNLFLVWDCFHLLRRSNLLQLFLDLVLFPRHLNSQVFSCCLIQSIKSRLTPNY